MEKKKNNNHKKWQPKEASEKKSKILGSLIQSWETILDIDHHKFVYGWSWYVSSYFYDMKQFQFWLKPRYWPIENKK